MSADEVWVLTTAKRRVRHIAVWSTPSGPAGPLCRNRALQGKFYDEDGISFEPASSAPGVPWCTRCAAEARAFAQAVDA
jgi:hypothetical protein